MYRKKSLFFLQRQRKFYLECTRNDNVSTTRVFSLSLSLYLSLLFSKKLKGVVLGEKCFLCTPLLMGLIIIFDNCYHLDIEQDTFKEGSD